MTPLATIRVIDLETTGLCPPEHAVCEIGWCDVAATTTDLAGAPSGWTVAEDWEHCLVHPGRPIPPEASAVHHIIDDDLMRALSFDAALAKALRALPDAAILAAHNAKFERQWLTPERVGARPWICTYKCALRLFPDAPSHGNQTLRYWLNPIDLNRDLASFAHRAGPDAYVTAFLLRALLERASLESLIKWSSEPALQARCHIGKWRGTPWREVDTGFLLWVLERDFDEDVLFTARDELARRERDAADEMEATCRVAHERALYLAGSSAGRLLDGKEHNGFPKRWHDRHCRVRAHQSAAPSAMTGE